MLAPFAEMQQRPRAVELAGHVVIGVAHLQGQAQALLGRAGRRPVLRAMAQQMRVAADVQAQMPALTRAPHGVDGQPARLGILVAPPARTECAGTP